MHMGQGDTWAYIHTSVHINAKSTYKSTTWNKYCAAFLLFDGLLSFTMPCQKEKSQIKYHNTFY